MTKLSTAHHTIVVTRIYDASPSRVFAAWRDPAALARWYVPGDGSWTSRILAHDFRVGGAKHMTFGPKDGPQYSEDCRFEDIAENTRICYVMTVTLGAERITTSMVTVEISARAGGSEIVVTDQLVILNGGDTAEGREKGWGETLDKLPAELNRRTH